MRPILGFSLILGTCAVIFVGVAGGYRSPLVATPDAGSDAAIAQTRGASLLTSASLPISSAQSNELWGGVSPPR